MDTLRLKPRQPVEDVVENWDDDDDFLLEGDDLTFRSSSTTAPHATNTNPGSRRESHSSFRSDLESIHTEEQQVLLPGDDEKSTMDAIAMAANAGIPLPKNVSPSALMGGTIKRLGGRKIKKIFQEDWGDDLEFPDDAPLQVKQQDASKFPDAIRQVSGDSTHTSPLRLKKTTGPTLIRPSDVAATAAPPSSSRLSTASMASSVVLDQFRDSDDEDDDFFGDGLATIKVPKRRQPPQPISLITPPTPQKSDAAPAVGDDDFENDLELPSDGKLTLTKRRDIPKTPSLNTFDDCEWEGSLGTRFGGTRRDGRSNRSSSVSALSPSVASSITAESEGEDDTFDGLVLPTGPVNFNERLQRRRQSRSPERSPAPAPAQPQQQQQPPPPPPQQQQQRQPPPPPQQQQQYQQPQQPQQPKDDQDDFLADLDLGDGEVFETSRPTLHRNVQIKKTRPTSPFRPKTEVSISFNRPSAGVSRLPRPMGTHERTHTASSLEPVSETGGPIYSRRSQSRIGHSAQSSVSSIPTPSTPSSSSMQSMAPSTPRRRELGQKASASNMRMETTTNAQLLRLKRSLPVMRSGPSPAPRPGTTRGGYERPPSRTELGGRPQSGMRPKTPVERMRPSVESAAAQARKNPLPFLPAGASASQSHHVTAKSSRVFRRHDSETSVEFRPNSRAVSRSNMRSPSPSKRYRYNMDKLQDGTYQQLNRPRRLRQFGDGHELDAFDDLPTSAQAESRFLRQPAGFSTKPPMRSKVYQNVLPDRTSTPSPLRMQSPGRTDHLPHFARDTTASRIARETARAQRTPSGPLAPLASQRVAQLSTRNNYNAPLSSRDAGGGRSKKTSRRPPQLKPHLISNLSGSKEPRTLEGMVYNPATMRWEGNENALSAFEAPISSPSTASVPQQHVAREKEASTSTPRPALITPIGATKGVQVVGGMVFDPQNMCWLKLGPQKTQGGQRASAAAATDDSVDGFNGMDSDEDVFKDIPDLDDTVDTAEGGGGGGGRVSDIKDDWLVGEEFDVGPEFVRRQREEEQRWRKKCERWMAFEDRNQSTWRWLLHEMVTNP